MIKTKNLKNFLIPSFADLIFVSIFIILCFSTGKGLLTDADTALHIRTGQYIVNTLSVPTHDIYSFTTPPFPWTVHEWLSEVIMAFTYRLGGVTGIVVLFSFLLALIYYLLLKVLSKDGENIVISLFLVLIAVSASLIHWLARPHIFTLLLTLVWYHELDEYQHKDKNKRLFILPLLMVLWVNLHGGFVIGFVLISIYLFGNIVKAFTAPVSEKYLYKKKSAQLGIMLGLCFLTSQVNPQGYRILWFPFHLIFDNFLVNHNLEFMAPNFHLIEVKPFEFIILSLITVFSASKKKIDIIELIVIISFLHMALFSARYIPLFAILAAPVLQRQLDPMLQESNGHVAKFLKTRSINLATIDRPLRGYLWPVVAILLVVVSVQAKMIVYRFDPKKMPVAAVDFLKREHLKGHMFDKDQFGDYIIYSAWPSYKVFLDGRSDMYGDQRLRNYLDVIEIKPDWKEVLNKYQINWIIYDANSSLCSFLMQNNDWKLIYSDKVADIFVRNIMENQEVIQKYPNVKPVPINTSK